MSLRQDLHALKSYHQAKKLFWNPQALDYTQDKADWATLNDREKDLVRRVLSLFLAGETFVTHDLAPLLIALRHEGNHLEDEMFLTTQLFEESKHVEFFDDVLTQVVGEVPDITEIAGDSYRQLFETELGTALGTLLHDHSHAAQVDAVVTYHIIIEGTLAETGYYGLFTALRDKNLMPAFTQGLEYIQRDEARHIAFGLNLLTRIIEADPKQWGRIQARTNNLVGLTQGIITEVLDKFLPDIPLGLDLNDIMMYSAGQFMARMNVLERAHSAD